MFLTERSARPIVPAVLHSLFFAVLLDVETQGRVGAFTEAYRRHNGLAGAPRPRHTLHISLWSLTRKTKKPPPGLLLDHARAVGFRIAQSPFKAQFNRVESWPRAAGSWPLVLLGDDGVVGLERLHGSLALAHGARPAPGFNPHVTLMWGKDAVAPEPVRPLCFSVREFALVHSHVGDSRYDIKARFPLVYG